MALLRDTALLLVCCGCCASALIVSARATSWPCALGATGIAAVFAVAVRERA